jgi:hypothetical protein
VSGSLSPRGPCVPGLPGAIAVRARRLSRQFHCHGVNCSGRLVSTVACEGSRAAIWPFLGRCGLPCSPPDGYAHAAPAGCPGRACDGPIRVWCSNGFGDARWFGGGADVLLMIFDTTTRALDMPDCHLCRDSPDTDHMAATGSAASQRSISDTQAQPVEASLDGLVAKYSYSWAWLEDNLDDHPQGVRVPELHGESASQQWAVAPRADRDSRRFCLGRVLLGLAGGEFMCSSRWSPLPLWCL